MSGAGGEGSPSASAVSLELIAEVTAHLQVGAPRDEVLARAGLDEERWTTAQEALLERLAARAAAGDLRMPQRFADLVTRCEQKAREERQGKPKPLDGKLPAPPEARLLRIWRNGAQGAGAAGAAVAAPSIQAAPILHAPPVQPPPAYAVPAPAVVPAQPPPVPPPSIIQMPAAAQVPVTSAGPSSSAAPHAAVARPPKQLWKTGPIDLSVRSAALPFAPAAAAAQPTGGGANAHLPFRAAVAGSAAGQPNAVPAAAPVDSAWRALEDYARICARVRVAPGRVPALMAELGLDAGAWQRMHAEWGRRFEQNPQLRAHWQRMIEAHARQGAGV